MRAVQIGLALHAILAIALCFVPLFDVLGFERAFASGLLAGPTAAGFGMAIVRRARQTGALALPALTFISVLVGFSALFPTLLTGLGVEHFRTSCDPGQGVAFVGLLGGGNAVFGAAVGVAAATLSRGRLGPALVIALAFFGNLACALYRLYAEPQIFLYSLAFGYWPGSLYDEEIATTGALWAHRGEVVLFAAALIGLVEIRLEPRELLAGRGPFIGQRALVGLGCAALAWAYAARGEALGFDLTRASIGRVLSREVVTEHFEIHADPSIRPRDLERLADDHAFRYQQLVRFFGQAPQGRIRSYVYRDIAQKKKLIGAGGTQIARPWAQEIHIHGFESPHPVLKHELAHVFAGAFADGPFRVPARSLIFVDIGVVEGIAVAADWPLRTLTIHGWARAMRELGLLPNVRRALSPTGFWGLSSARAYTATGSLIRYLIDRYGIERFKILYSTDDFRAAYGHPLEALADEWEGFIDAMPPVSPSDRMIARHQFSQPSIFEKICAHTAANLNADFQELLAGGHLDAAIATVQALSRYQPSRIEPLLALVAPLAEAGRIEEARALAQRALIAQGITDRSRGQAREVVADLDWRAERLEAAAAGYREVLDQHLSREAERLELAKLGALARPAQIQQVLRQYLLGEFEGCRGTIALAELAHSGDSLVDYLYSRRLEIDGLPEQALGVLSRMNPDHLDPPLAREAALAEGRLKLQLGRPAEAKAQFDHLSEIGSEVDRLTAADWAERAALIGARPTGSTTRNSDIPNPHSQE